MNKAALQTQNNFPGWMRRSNKLKKQNYMNSFKNRKVLHLSHFAKKDINGHLMEQDLVDKERGKFWQVYGISRCHG